MIDDKLVLDELNRCYALTFESIRFVRTGGSDSFIVKSQDKAYFLRIVSNAFISTVRHGVEVQSFLLEREFPTTSIVKADSGDLYISIVIGSVSYTAILYRYLNGTEPKENEDLGAIGELAGRLHNTMHNYKGELEHHGEIFFIHRYIELLRKKKYHCDKLDSFQKYGMELWDKVKGLPQGYCHGDFHRGNIIRDNKGRLHLIDFDSSSHSFPMYDVMVVCDSTDYFRFTEDGLFRSRRALEEFLVGYGNHCELTDDEISSFFNLIAIRHYQLQATIIEIHGLNCIDENFLDKQWKWLEAWKEQCTRLGV